MKYNVCHTSLRGSVLYFYSYSIINAEGYLHERRFEC